MKKKKNPYLIRPTVIFTLLYAGLLYNVLELLGFTVSEIGTVFICVGLYSLLLKKMEDIEKNDN